MSTLTQSMKRHQTPPDYDCMQVKRAIGTADTCCTWCHNERFTLPRSFRGHNVNVCCFADRHHRHMADPVTEPDDDDE